MYQRAAHMAAQFKAKGANIVLGYFFSFYSLFDLFIFLVQAKSNVRIRPVAGPLGRSARGGRNWEGFSPDPYLTGVAFSQTIEGIQSQGVQGVY
jgi:beta-glucosidase